MVLEYRMDRTVATADEPPVVLGTMPAAFVERMGAKLRFVTLGVMGLKTFRDTIVAVQKRKEVGDGTCGKFAREVVILSVM